MNREQLIHAIRAACEIIDADSIIVIGSQSILGSYDEDDLPAEATVSREVDVLAPSASIEEQQSLATRIDGAAGAMSPFDEQHGFHLDGVDEETAILPPGWRKRLVRFPHNGHYSVVRKSTCTGWCLEPHDMCAAKLCAGRPKDLRFVHAVIAAGLVDVEVIRARLRSLPPEHADKATRAETFIR